MPPSAWRARSFTSFRGRSSSPLCRSRSAPASASRPAIKRGSGDTDLAGMAVRDGGAVETMLRRADMAMYWAKADGRGRYRFFDRSMDEKLRQRVELESQIGGAITLGQIVPYYQRIVRLETGETIGFEVLARWVHPTAWRAHVRCFHRHRRGHRNDRQDDRSADRARHARRQGLARASLGVRQFLATADLRPQRRNENSRPADQGWLSAASAGDGDHRGCGGAEARSRQGRVAIAPQCRRAHRARRFRHRLFRVSIICASSSSTSSRSTGPSSARS